MSDYLKVLKGNPYRGNGGMFTTKAKATSTKLSMPKQVSKPQKPELKAIVRPGKLKF